MHAARVTKVDLILVDAQGAETVLLESAREHLLAGRVRFMVVSTHHHAISGDPLTHQRALCLLKETGAHVIAEHSVSESYSGDGLIAVSFDSRDRDLAVSVSRARAKDSLFGELEYDLKAADERCTAAEQRATIAEARAEQTWSEGERLRAQITAMENTKLWRWMSGVRAQYGHWRSRFR
jgi:hypothetical protein